MDVQQAMAWAQALDDRSSEQDDNLIYQDGQLVGVRVTERGTRELLRWLTPLIMHGLPFDAPPELRQAAGMAITHLLVIKDLRVFSRAELAGLLVEAGLSLPTGVIFNQLRQMYWVARAPQGAGDYLVITDPVWSSVACLVGKI